MNRVHHPVCCIEVEAWPTREAFRCDDAEIWIDADSILISYFDDEGMVVLEGRPEPSGGWQLVARSRPWRAFLRPISDSPDNFAGEIDEQGERVAWRVRFGPDPGPAES